MFKIESLILITPFTSLRIGDIRLEGWRLLSSLICHLVKVTLTDEDGSWMWSPASSGLYQVRDIASALDNVWMACSDNTPIWSNLQPKKVNLFVWRAQRNFFPSLQQLVMRAIPVPSITCPLCSCGSEDVEYALFRCPLTQKVWEFVVAWWSVHTLALWDCDDVVSPEILSLVPAAARQV